MVTDTPTINLGAALQKIDGLKNVFGVLNGRLAPRVVAGVSGQPPFIGALVDRMENGPAGLQQIAKPRRVNSGLA